MATAAASRVLSRLLGFPIGARHTGPLQRSTTRKSTTLGGLFNTQDPFCHGKRRLYTEVTSSTQLKEALRETDKLLVTQFSAAWCGPCRKTKPVIMKWGEQYSEQSVDFLAVDIDELADLTDQYQITSVPTFILTRNGEQLEKVVGADLERLKSAIEKHRAK